MNWCQSYLERNVIERIKNTKQNKSCLQHEACLRFKTESPNAYHDTLMHMYECSQKSSDNQPAPTTPRPSPLSRTVFTQRLVSDHVYEVNVHGDRYLNTILVDPNVKIPTWYCLEDEAVVLLICTSHSTRSLDGTGYFLRWNRRGEF